MTYVTANTELRHTKHTHRRTKDTCTAGVDPIAPTISLNGLNYNELELLKAYKTYHYFTRTLATEHLIIYSYDIERKVKSINQRAHFFNSDFQFIE